MLSSFLAGYAFWLLLGLALLISEFFIPGLVAAFFGIGAVIVGVLTLLGLIDGLAQQLAYFAMISLAALFSLRRHCQRWLKGSEADRAKADLDDTGVLGARVVVLTDFVDGVGDVQLHGAKWDAESDEPLKVGESAWVVDNRSIVLRVSSQPPGTTNFKSNGV